MTGDAITRLRVLLRDGDEEPRAALTSGDDLPEGVQLPDGVSEEQVRALVGAFGGGAAGAGGAGGAAGGAGLFASLADIELPEGVTIQEVVTAFANGEELPAGVTLPDDFELSPEILDAITSGAAAGGRGGPPGGPGGGDAQGALALQPLPVPGMSASVTVLLAIEADLLLVPIGAVRQLGDDYFVVVPAEGELTTRTAVVPGTTDGVLVAIQSGLDDGDEVLIGVDTSGSVPYRGDATFDAPAAQQPAGAGAGGGGRFGGGGAGGGAGGGGAGGAGGGAGGGGGGAGP